eukprot:NODE_851_length_1811_cov_8.114014_g796_i0.p1 GENE.NODE_851_length_1811_cov_8.114014_g796_i0~~NODE_851_length_1811_cov_8.114014_g796_i0.p1  ORF type:complete len:434 (+),score=118.99 NODE_851_length_1811_cov_8.114014_g796_i0:432-1733(+)
MVTICTELSYKSFVKKYSHVTRGCVRFRPSGGNTAKRIDAPLAKWVMGSSSELLQAAMLARAECEFYDSEPLLFHWALTMKPDLLIYGFTMASVAVLLSEALHLPLLGFILQPTCIPSAQYPAVVPIDTHMLPQMDSFEKRFVSHGAQATLKALMELNPLGESLGAMRTRRGLQRHPPSTTWQLLRDMNQPLIVPIEATCFGGKPTDWNEESVLTDFIFLRSGPTAPLSPQIMEFIEAAKSDGAPLVALGFSSMPVARQTILEIAIKMIEECIHKPRVIALAGERPPETVADSVSATAAQLKGQRLLLEQPGAPFGLLFAHMSCLVVHGGLGTTAEALRVGVPCMVTGVLLMDQRFWGQRVHQLGVGPPPTHISAFKDVCVDRLNTALDPSGEWATNARQLAQRIQGRSCDGVPENVAVIESLLPNLKPVHID